jgi:uncharacterized protein
MIFGTDWPGVPGPKANARAVADLGLERETLANVLHENASRIYKLDHEKNPQHRRPTRDESHRS